MSEYRWNFSEFAVAYDQAAERIHPYYLELQDAILQNLSLPADTEALLVDMGGGSGRLIERALDKWPKARGLVLDQSEPFLALAERRLARFGSRTSCVLSRLQDDWQDLLSTSPAAIVSMSAIHHLDPAEKQTFYQRCWDALAPGGQLLNGDEVRPEEESRYLPILQEWVAMWEDGIASGSIPPGIHAALRGWTDRNVTRFGQPKQSGDDCHETAAVQVQYLRTAGFAEAKVFWHKKLWALLSATKGTG
ncbi:MAG: class I SAM-dependent methyltransferase [Planctomycetales bacterium]|nr:class I SAM-dependent methyltransferase [Planctomycetales bacterium]